MDKRLPGAPNVFRFCIVYGVICILMTPLLGASVDRLVGYAWPLYFVVLPWFLLATYKLSRCRSAAILVLHLLTSWLAWFGFRQQAPGDLFAGMAVVALNGVAYALITRQAPLFYPHCE
jgi:hypothetical protein